VKQSKGELKQGSGGWRRLKTSERSYHLMPEQHKTESTAAKCGTGGQKQRVGVEASQHQGIRHVIQHLMVSNEMWVAKMRACNIE
jgi:hypothetical protein